MNNQIPGVDAGLHFMGRGIVMGCLFGGAVAYIVTESWARCILWAFLTMACSILFTTSINAWCPNARPVISRLASVVTGGALIAAVVGVEKLLSLFDAIVRMV